MFDWECAMLRKVHSKSRPRDKIFKVLWFLSFKKGTQVRTFFMMSLHISFRCWSRLMFSSIVLMEYTTVE